jgi:hypothetical protein
MYSGNKLLLFDYRKLFASPLYDVLFGLLVTDSAWACSRVLSQKTSYESSSMFVS